VVNFTSDYNYIWDNSIEGLDCYEDCEEINVAPETQNTYYVTVINEFGCWKKDSISIDVESTFNDFLIESIGICEDSSTTISITDGNNVIWQSDSEIECINCEANVVSPSIDQYFYASVTSPLGCLYEDSILVEVIPEMSADAGLDQEICKGEQVTLNAEGFGQPTWSLNGSMIDTINTINQAPQQSSTYLLEMTYDECIQNDSVFITVYEKADIEGLGDTICVGEIATASVSGRADTYKWMENNSSENSIEINPDSTTVYTVIGDFRTCESDTALIEVYVHPKIIYELEETFYNIHLNDEIMIDPSYDIARLYSYDWWPIEGLTCDDCPNPMISGIMESIDYSLIISDDESGCQEELEIRVRFNNECTQNVFHLANIFSPNGNGANKEFKVITDNEDEFLQLSIFDRYGNLMFQEQDISEGWNGMYNGRTVEQGVYVYKVDLICPFSNETYSVFGDVTVVKY